MTVFCLKVKRLSYKEQRELDLGEPVVVLDSFEIRRVQTPPACLRNPRGCAGFQCQSEDTQAVGEYDHQVKQLLHLKE